jgi:hypothetical protein
MHAGTAVNRFVRWWPFAWSGLLSLLLLGPALLPGYVLSYDMVWVPKLALRSDFLGLGPGVPRAVPSDAVVAVLDDIVPAQLLQKVVLLGGLMLLAWGAIRLVGGSPVARGVAASLAIWNPFVVERLHLGHWPVLLGYAAVPWLVVQVRHARERGRIPLVLFWLVPIGSLSASAGIVTGLVVGVVGMGRRPDALWGRLVSLAVAANAPWVVAGLLHLPRHGALVGTEFFALHSEGALPAPLAALTWGGIWNAEVVPGSRATVLAWVGLVGLAALGAIGVRAGCRLLGRDVTVRLGILWLAGYAIAVIGWLAPGVVDRMASAVPGAALFRDGTRYLGLCLPLVLCAVAAGADLLSRRPAIRAARVAAAGGCVLLPLMVLPDAAVGIGRQLVSVTFPSSWGPARAVLASAEQSRPGDLLVLPFTSYRAPDWNGGRKVLDPLGRFLTPNYLASDRLTVSGRAASGDDPRVPRVERALRDPDPDARAADLATLGIGYVVRDRTVAAAPDEVALPSGRIIYDDPTLTMVEITLPVSGREVPRSEAVAMVAAWVAFLAGPAIGLLGMARRRSRVRPVREP